MGGHGQLDAGSSPPAPAPEPEPRSHSFDLSNAASEDAALIVDPAASDPEAGGELQARVLRKLNRHLRALCFALTVLCYLDRSNLAFAALQLNADLGLTKRQYGIGSGPCFFVTYVLFQVPSNLAVVRWGGRLWLGLLALCWGAAAAAFAAVRTPGQFYALRLALGAAEAGTMPGMWYVMSLFYSEGELTLAWAWVLIGISASQVLGGPLAAGLLAADGFLGLRGWQVLFLAEGGLAVAAGLATWALLPDSPATARFLEPRERAWLQRRNAAARAAAAEAGSSAAALEAAKDGRTWHLAAISLLANVPKYGVIFWCPLILQRLLQSPGQAPASAPLVALLTAAVFAVSAAAVWLNSCHSLLTGERHLHVALPLLVAAAACGLLALLLDRAPVGAFCALLLLAVVWAPDAVMASWPATFLQGRAAATGVALINSVGSVGGILGPALIGFLADLPAGYALPLGIMAGVALLVALLAFAFPDTSGRAKDHASDDGPPAAADSP